MTRSIVPVAIAKAGDSLSLLGHSVDSRQHTASCRVDSQPSASRDRAIAEAAGANDAAARNLDSISNSLGIVAQTFPTNWSAIVLSGTLDISLLLPLQANSKAIAGVLFRQG
jgi:hypothetical protein